MLNRSRAQRYLTGFEFEALFLEELGWDRVDGPGLPLALEAETFEVIPIAQKRGFVVYQCIRAEMPAPKQRKQLASRLKEYSQAHLLVFGDGGRTAQDWLWLKPEPGQRAKVRSQSYRVGQSAEPLLQKLEALVIDWNEEDQLTHVDVTQKVKKGFDIEAVTKQFFQDFEGLHADFCGQMEGIGAIADRRWYGSVLLNRLMFVYFLQRRYFLDRGNANYLQDKLQGCQAQGENFYGFLKDLFFEGFAKPEYERNPAIRQQLGKICYLNGGLFLRHPIEEKYPDITIKDEAFQAVFNLFARYSWHLDDRPDKDPLEINPDVLGYIFEKYINQKEFGAYYTRPEITEYLCDRTIKTLIRERLGCEDVVYAALTPEECERLLVEILPGLTLLDPACGSGAFLVAAMKTLIAVYEGVVARVQRFDPTEKIGVWLQEVARHPSLEYYVKKRIITDNLYGVDIMEEATEIAKLRLFLALVAAAKRVEDLEPLPNIDFNIMAGNSLIGLIRVDGEGFDRLGGGRQFGHDPTQKNLLGPTAIQGNLLSGLAASEYEAILKDKNKSIALYKKHAFQAVDEDLPQETRLLQLRNHIEKLNQASQAKLNKLLLDEFGQNLGIQYEEAQLTGKAKKRLLDIADIEALKPFHWGYHFDAVFKRGGFDAIIANPPWEVFKPNAKEFFAKYSDLVTKKKMDIKAFQKAKKKLLEDPEIAQAWNDYQSQFPHVSAYYRSSEDYANQISIVNGRKAGTDINLYKLFLERCFKLLRPRGRCGIILPAGIYTDLGSKQLREMLFSQCQLDSLFGLSNEKFIFESVHHAFKFSLLAFQKGNYTEGFDGVFRINPREAIRPSELGDFLYDKDEKIHLSVSLVRRLSPDSLSVMEFKQPIDIVIAEKMLKFPLLGEKIEGKWNLKLTREFDMTNDSHLFKPEPAPGRLPLYEGKMIHQFNHQFAQPRYWVDEQEGRKAVLGKKAVDQGQKLDYQGYRLGFRDVASSTNERTMISTILPPKIFTGNTLITSMNFLDHRELILVSAILDSFIVDSILRQKVTAHCNMFYVYATPIPRLQAGDSWFGEICDRAAQLICTTPEFDDLAAAVGLGSHQNGSTNPAHRAQLRAELDGIIAHLYGLTEAEFSHILSTFPIVPDDTKTAALNAYRAQSKPQKNSGSDN
ncbi:Eco57I restriction-modification methylase domain-containing protein [Spirulina major]|uniref:Eco57I restriction-modification methylase domain-containing protein n=1 Tax=Spirulina major TaxID=270636 RepID=UPI0009FE3EA3|nr:DNA methyltransferase [Spirulina major]